MRVARNEVTYYLELRPRFQWFAFGAEIDRDSGKRRTILLLYLRTSAPSGMVPSSLFLSFHFGPRKNFEERSCRVADGISRHRSNERHWSNYHGFFPRVLTAEPREKDIQDCVRRWVSSELLKYWIAIIDMISRVSYHHLSVESYHSFKTPRQEREKNADIKIALSLQSTPPMIWIRI